MSSNDQDDIHEEFLALLERFEMAVIATGSSVIGNLNQGAEPSYVIERLAEIGMEPSVELLTWFAWHNGYDESSGGYDSVGSWRYQSVEAAIADYTRRERGTEPWHWDPTWLPIGDSGSMPRLVADCAPPQGHDCTVMAVSPDAGLFSEPDRRTRSLSQAVQMWLEAVESGWYTWVRIGDREGWDSPLRYVGAPWREYGSTGIL